MKRYMLWITVIILLFIIVGCSDKKSNVNAKPSNTSVLGETLFRQNCAACHGRDGKKMAWWKPKLQTMSQANVEKQVREGGGNMPAFGKKLPDKQITDVAKYAKQLAGK